MNPCNLDLLELSRGQKLYITLLDNRIFEGTYIRHSKARKSIIIHNVSLIPDGKPFEQLELKVDQILQIGCLSEETNQENRAISIETCPDPKNVAPQNFDGILYDKVKDCVENFILIDSMGLEFAQAIRALEKAEIVAVTGEGTEKGRFGHLTILGVALHNSVFLFDILNLGAKAFEAHGRVLKKVLETKHVLKVVYNCCLLSDCLWHNYGITLQNIFDTQACHFIILKNKRESPASAHFSELVSLYLNLPGNVCEAEDTSSELWKQRPLDVKLARVAAWRVALLRKLKAPMDNSFHAPFDNLCQMYLTSVRDLDDELDAKILMQQNLKDGYLKSVVDPDLHTC